MWVAEKYGVRGQLWIGGGVQYALAAGGSKDTCVLRISYDVNYLRPTIMRNFINNGIDVSMRKHFQVSARESEMGIDAYHGVQRYLPDTHALVDSGARARALQYHL